jgi:transcriptional regulator with XRE-family HTH domain
MPDSDLDRALLGERLRQAREYLELSQDEVAKKLDIPRSAVSLIESGQRRVDAIELRRLAQLYQRPVSYFTGEAVVAAIPEDVEHLARTAKKLSDRDREELARFAEFLSSRAASRNEDAK